jgi:hypothetical protein
LISTEAQLGQGYKQAITGLLPDLTKVMKDGFSYFKDEVVHTVVAELTPEIESIKGVYNLPLPCELLTFQ